MMDSSSISNADVVCRIDEPRERERLLTGGLILIFEISRFILLF